MSFENKKLIELNEFLKKSKVAIIGLGVSNIPILEYMHNLGANVSVFDDREEKKIAQDILNKVQEYNFTSYFGEDSLYNLKNFDIIFRSPSCMPTRKELVAEKERGAIIITEIEMFMKLFPGKIIGITGSDGKYRYVNSRDCGKDRICKPKLLQYRLQNQHRTHAKSIHTPPKNYLL